jgi:hypothetical protein
MQQFYKFITWRFVSLNMFQAPPRPSSGAYNCINSLWFYLGALLVVVTRPRPTTLLPLRSKVKPEAVSAVVKLLMMGVEAPETCWATHKRKIINL